MLQILKCSTAILALAWKHFLVHKFVQRWIRIYYSIKLDSVHEYSGRGLGLYAVSGWNVLWKLWFTDVSRRFIMFSQVNKLCALWYVSCLRRLSHWFRWCRSQWMHGLRSWFLFRRNWCAVLSACRKVPVNKGSADPSVQLRSFRVFSLSERIILWIHRCIRHCHTRKAIIMIISTVILCAFTAP